MGVVYAATGRAKPGRWDDCLREASHVAKVFERHGIDHVRFSTTAIAGEAEGQWAFSAEFPSASAYGTALHHVSADDEYQAIMSFSRSDGSPAIVQNTMLMVEVPTKAQRGSAGSITESHLSRLTSIGGAQMLASFEEAAPIIRRNGAVGTRLFQLVYAGSMSGCYVTAFEYPDLPTFGAALDKWSSDPEAKALLARFGAPDGPSMPLSSSVYVDIPL